MPSTLQTCIILTKNISVIHLYLYLFQVLAPLKFSSTHDNSLGDLIADSRCICVCPHNVNTTTKLNSTVFVMEVSDPGNW